MRQVIKEFVSVFAQSFSVVEPVYEFGALRVPGQETFSDLRPYFPGKEYVGADMREGLGVDKVLNLHAIDLPDHTAGAVLCLDTLEHVEYPHKAAAEIFRILKADGIAVISSVMRFPIHDYPYDYWRFTPEAFRSILKPFSASFVGFAGEERFPHTVVGIGFKGSAPSLTAFEKIYMEWQTRHFRQSDMSPGRRIRKLLTPPIFSKSSRKALGL